ncbi:hypothetical protein QP446_11340 [Corynebacterium riegelii]|uniref:hypothetical protein n=1 Tax=Corynebacterium riegelii TaxID=156976 RepID=UPI00254FE496|nr:hypothetical protein [Corynebacterium riegelii]MDK7181343.1 hypothetical protein [Corynebacterium riegelii]
MSQKLRVPCTYQGGKQRLAPQITEILLRSTSSPDFRFYDLCCGSGAISIELINRGVPPERITMLDQSSWGSFWNAIGTGTFEMSVFEEHLAQVPTDKSLVKTHMEKLAKQDPEANEAEIYPILQSSSFGGKQLWWDGNKWQNAFFRDYWQPTPTSVRRSPANPMQPRPEELHRRIELIHRRMSGVKAIRSDISELLNSSIPDNAVIYIDPPYLGTTNYGFDFEISAFVAKLKTQTQAAIFVSEGSALGPHAVEIFPAGANGGITGNRSSKHREWLTRF